MFRRIFVFQLSIFLNPELPVVRNLEFFIKIWPVFLHDIWCLLVKERSLKQNWPKNWFLFAESLPYFFVFSKFYFHDFFSYFQVFFDLWLKVHAALWLTRASKSVKIWTYFSRTRLGDRLFTSNIKFLMWTQNI